MFALQTTMAGRNAKRVIAAVITITSVVVFTSVLVHAAFYSSESETEQTTDGRADSGLSPKSLTILKAKTEKTPLLLKVPSVGISAPVQLVGVAQSGHMAVPSNYTSVGWYRYGAEPGKIGTAVVDGHLDNGLGLHAVFWNLSKVSIADKIYVTDANGKNYLYKVSRIDSFNLNDSAAANFIFENEGEPTLRLVTCEGDWQQNDRTYNERLVVTAVLQK